MAKFKSKVVEVMAEQFFPEKGPWPKGVMRGGFEGRNNKPTHWVENRDGKVCEVFSGDWIVAESNGHGYYPVSDEAFKEKYEPVK